MSFQELDRVRSPMGEGVVLEVDDGLETAYVFHSGDESTWFRFAELEAVHRSIEVRLNEFDARHWHELMVRFRHLLTVLDDEELSPEGTKAVEQLLRVVREGPEDLAVE